MRDLVISHCFEGAMFRAEHLVPGWNVLHVAHESVELGAHGNDLRMGHATGSTRALQPSILTVLVSFDKVWTAAAFIYLLALQLDDHF